MLKKLNMNVLIILAICSCLTLQTESKKRKYGHATHVNAAKRTKYNDEGLEPNLEMGTATSGPDDGDIINNYATENTPVFWRDVYEGRQKTHFKKTEEEGPPDGFELAPDELPNTVGPSGNVYGGFPVNDMLGGFELPSPETLAILKAALKKHGPRNEYESHLHHDLENWAYGYEHHALPEYDVKETPPFYVTMLEGLKMAEENKKKPSCQQGCEPMLHLNDDQCNTLAGNCMPSKPVTQTSYKEPCPWKIIEMLFGCKKPPKPKPPMMTGKPDGIEPPPPKPDEPEKPAAEKPEKPEKEEKEEKVKEKKPKAIPIQFEEGHATPEHVDKQVDDIKDEAKTSKDASKATQTDPPSAKLQGQLGLLGLLSKSASAKQEPQSRMDFAMPAGNNSTAKDAADVKDAADAKELPTEVQSMNVPVETDQPPNALKTEEKGDTGKQGSSFDAGKAVLDLSILPVPEAIQIGSLKSRHVPSNNTDDASLKSGNITKENKKEKTGAASKKIDKTAAKLSEGDNKSYAVGGRDIRKGALLSTKKVAINNIGPVIASLGKELEQRLNQKFALANQGDTEFTIDVGINPDKNRRSKIKAHRKVKGKRLRKF